MRKLRIKTILYYFIIWAPQIIREIIGSIFIFYIKSEFAAVGKRVKFCSIPFITGINRLTLGNNITFTGNIFIRAEGGVKIGNNCIFSRNIVIYSYNHQYEGELLPFDNSNVYKPVIIGDNVWIGQDVCILPGVHIGDGAVIGMGSVVTKDVPECAIAAGNPIRVIKYRDTSRYQKLIINNNYINDNGLIFYIMKIINSIRSK